MFIACAKYMIECNCKYLVDGVWCISGVRFIHSILDLGEQVDSWSVRVPLLLLHCVVGVQLYRVDIAVGVEEVLEHHP